MQNVKKYNWFIFLAMLLYVISFVLILMHFKNLETDNRATIDTSYSTTITYNYKNKKPENLILENSLSERRLWALDSIYNAINKLYNKQSDLYSKGLASKENVKVLEIEKDMALQSLLHHKKKQSKELLSKAN